MQQLFTILFAVSAFALPEQRIAPLNGSCGGAFLGAPTCGPNASCVFPKTPRLGAPGVCKEILSYGDKPCGGRGPFPTRCAPFYQCSVRHGSKDGLGECVSFGGFGPVNTGSEGSRCGAVFGENCQHGLVCDGDNRAEGVCQRVGAGLAKRSFPRVAAIGETCGPTSLMCQENAQCVVPKGKGFGASGVCREVLSYGDKPCGGNGFYPTRCAPFFQCNVDPNSEDGLGQCVNSGGFGPVNTGSEGSRCGAIFGDNCQRGLVCTGDDRAEGVCQRSDGSALAKRFIRVAAIGEHCGPTSLVCQENAQCVLPKGKGFGASGVCREVFSYGDKPCGGNGFYPTRCAPFFRCSVAPNSEDGLGQCVSFGGFGPVNTGAEGSRCGAIFGDNCQNGLTCTGDDTAEGVCAKN